MLYKYENKVYIKPFGDKLVEVKVTKKGDEYNVEATKTIIVIDSKVSEKMYSISLEEAYKMQNKASFNKEN